MSSPATCPTAEPDGLSEIASAEAALWKDGFDAAKLADYQAAHRRLEETIAATGDDRRHKFIVFVPVADRPQQLATCLDSLLSLCRAYGYGGLRDGRWHKVEAVIAEDSAEPESIAAHRALAERVTAGGLTTHHFGPEEQAALLASMDDDERAALAPAIGDVVPTYRGRKGQGAMRNLAHLHLARLQRAAPHERLLFWSIDSDQEFSVKIATPDGDLEANAISFFHRLDEIFERTDALLLTGKVVGDPPVSPAVMTGNFLADVLGFLDEAFEGDPRSVCRHHDRDTHREGEAAYHDMAERFGFRHANEAYRYPCPLDGWHTEADCFAHFAARLNGFFYGEHPTRVSRYLHDELWRTVQPARTVYAGNYVARPESLAHFIPFAPLRLRMSGPTLGRLLKGQLGARFVSANLPMLHKRTVTGSTQSEFRPGVTERDARIDLNDEFERQFFGDVMLFSMERLTAAGYPDRRIATADQPKGRRTPRSGGPEQGEGWGNAPHFCSTLDALRDELLAQYNSRRADILAKLARLRERLDDPTAWWSTAAHGAAIADFRNFADNVERNFGDAAPWFARINSPEHWLHWRGRLANALERHPDDAQAWAAAIARQAGHA
ncbi:MAG: hypothetical protein KJ634_06290 [Gammaproteobacteria bacterium]|nr:hypothetical protein [Gammaproteobacteria bacterium]MBU1415214.1 hypothetical protein [Gammaproteobacteria bacterium]